MSGSDLTPSIVPKDDDQVANRPARRSQFDVQAAMAKRLEEANARAYEQFKRPREDQQEAKNLEADALEPLDDGRISSDIRGNPRSLFGRRAAIVIKGLVLVPCIGAVALAWWSYGDTVKQMIVELQVATFSQQPSKKSELAMQSRPPLVQADAAESAPAQLAPKAQTSSSVAPGTALPAELAEKLQTMEHDIAAVRQGMEQLKATQEQMARDNAKFAEQNLRTKSAPPRQPVSTPAQERAVVLSALTGSKDPMTPTELATATGQSNRNIRRSLYQMLKSGEIVKHEKGRYGLQPKNSDNADQNGPVPALPRPLAE